MGQREPVGVVAVVETILAIALVLLDLSPEELVAALTAVRVGTTVLVRRSVTPVP